MLMMETRRNLGIPSDCPKCDLLRHRLRLRWRLQQPQTVNVKTWCRICGLPVLLNIVCDYDAATRFLYGLDDQVASHISHEEAGGWGIHWRFDDVLRAVFPRESSEEEHWPTPPWYEFNEAMGLNVQLISVADAMRQDPDAIDRKRLEIERELNRRPRTRVELEREVGRVWNTQELQEEFDVLAFRSPFVVAVRRSDDTKGSLVFQCNPRLYFGFEEGRVI